MARPEGPLCNSRDREVVVTLLKLIKEVRRTGIRFGLCRPFGPRSFVDDVDPDLTVGAIA
jgi:hypothetical protein